MSDLKVGEFLPEDIRETVPEGISGTFNGKLNFILKMEDLVDEDINIFNTSALSFDFLEIDTFKNEIGNLYAFSILVDGFIDNSEVLVDFRGINLNEAMPNNFNGANGLEVEFILCDEEDKILAIRELKLSVQLSNIVSKKAFEQNDFKAENKDKNMDYILLAFQKLFENEPEKNLELYSIGRSIAVK